MRNVRLAMLALSSVSLLGCRAERAKVVPIPFDAQGWIEAGSEIQIDRPSARTAMAADLRNRYAAGTSLFKILHELGDPDVVRNRESINPGDIRQYPAATALVVSYIVDATDDEWAEDLKFIFNSDGKLIQVEQELR